MHSEVMIIRGRGVGKCSEVTVVRDRGYEGAIIIKCTKGHQGLSASEGAMVHGAPWGEVLKRRQG